MGVPLCSLRHQTENDDSEMCQESLLSLSRVDAILPSNLRMGGDRQGNPHAQL